MAKNSRSRKKAWNFHFKFYFSQGKNLGLQDPKIQRIWTHDRHINEHNTIKSVVLLTNINGDIHTKTPLVWCNVLIKTTNQSPAINLKKYPKWEREGISCCFDNFKLSDLYLTLWALKIKCPHFVGDIEAHIVFTLLKMAIGLNVCEN